jgi:adenine/guanine/hypoxanthine permease
MGVSSVTTYVESGAGVGEGARTGLASLVTAGLFALAVFLVPLIALVGQDVKVGEETFIHPAIAPALVLVGYLMMRLVAGIDWGSPEHALPAFLIVAGVPLTFSIAAGIGLGVLGFVAVMVALGRAREVHPLMYALVPLFVAFFAEDWLSANVF